MEPRQVKVVLWVPKGTQRKLELDLFDGLDNAGFSNVWHYDGLPGDHELRWPQDEIRKEVLGAKNSLAVYAVASATSPVEVRLERDASDASEHSACRLVLPRNASLGSLSGALAECRQLGFAYCIVTTRDGQESPGDACVLSTAVDVASLVHDGALDAGRCQVTARVDEVSGKVRVTVSGQTLESAEALERFMAMIRLSLKETVPMVVEVRARSSMGVLPVLGAVKSLARYASAPCVVAEARRD